MVDNQDHGIMMVFTGFRRRVSTNEKCLEPGPVLGCCPGYAGKV